MTGENNIADTTGMMNTAEFVKHVKNLQPTLEDLYKAYPDALSYALDIHSQFDVKITSLCSNETIHLERIIKCTDFHKLSFAGIQFQNELKPLDLPGAEDRMTGADDLLQIARWHEDDICLSRDLKTMWYFELHNLFGDTNNVVTWSYNDEGLFQALLLVIKTDNDFVYHNLPPEKFIAQKLDGVMHLGAN